MPATPTPSRPALTLLRAAALLLLTACAWAQPSVEKFTSYGGLSTKLFDQDTLLKDWRAVDMPGVPPDRVGTVVPIFPFAKPDAPPSPPVAAVRSAAGAPVYNLDMGRLDVGCYVVRVIGMVKPDQIEQYRKPLYMDLRIKLPDGREEYHRQRIPYLADFYAVAELYFLVDKPGPCAATLTVGKGSMVELHIYNIELHDVLKDLAGKAVKQRPGLFTPEERDRLRKNANAEEVIASVRKWVKPMDPLWTDATKTLTPDERTRRDEMLWNAFPPIDSQHIGWVPTGFPSRENYEPEAPEARKAVADFGRWEGAMAGYGPLELTNAKLGLRYTRDDLVHHRPLPDPYPLKDDGGGVYLPASAGMAHAQNFIILAPLLTTRWTTLVGALGAWEGNDVIHKVPYLYHVLGNKNAARDAAFLLCRWAYIYPAMSDAMVLNGSLTSPAGIYKRDVRLTVRYLNEGLSGLQQGLAVSYDSLFDYIRGNQELAAAVGRFIPWVKTDEDIRRMIETRVLQFGAKQSMRFHIYNDKESPAFLMRTAAVQQDPAVTRPWMEYLWSRTWIYPHGRAGLPDYLSTTTQRDGSTDIGSVFYTQAGTPFMDLALQTRRYVLNGGDPAFDLSDVKRYAKVAEACRFPLASSVGAYPLSIGDVGGPCKPRLFASFFGDIERNFRTGVGLIHDPALAWVLVNYYGRGGETDAEWAAVTAQAARQKGNPFLGLPSRVLADWAGILETGQDAQDYRFLRAAIVRVGTGYGHQHEDTLDLQVMAHGVRAVNDLGWRGGYSAPHPTWTQLHNLVEINETNWQGHAWIAALAATPGAQYLHAIAVPPPNQASVKLRTREVALIDVDGGRPGTKPPAPLPYTDKTRFDPAAVMPNSYIFDVQRVAGGALHTFCFHGTYSDDFQTNAALSDALAAPEKEYVRRFMQTPGAKQAGAVPAVLQATWRLRRAEETVKGLDRDGKEVTLRHPNAEYYMQGAAYDPASPVKYTRLHLLGHSGDRVLVASPSVTENNSEKITWPFLFVRRTGTDLASVYPSIIEPYAGEPFINAVRLLPITSNEVDAQRAVAVEVTTRNGLSDICFSDARRKTRSVAGVTVAARFAHVSSDDKGLRLASFVEGTQLTTPAGTLRMDKPEWTAKVARVDFLARKVFLDADWPDAAVVGEQVEFGNDRHKTSYTVVDAARQGGALVLTLDKALDISYGHVKSVSPAQNLVTANIGPSITFPGANAGLACTVGDSAKSWTCAIVQSDADGCIYKLDGPFAAQDFPIGSVFQLWEFGAGDTARLSSRASVRRAPDGTWSVESNGKAAWSPKPAPKAQ